ncbi:hypothetical protein SPSIL_032770 [Sporomusa silvacetica DSM 10669]|uniref:Uncharacterized protein n=1 Tax=Sporomusa silvacetica DSM 10669 TaxID=1123289 RepID=A0ABZ3INX4_9FIRM|nr:hypothetical protein [Sporomusa silvacetica]OZC18034.1 hypothetical protein SPSIL_28330 [Sporomusa silvacetica DSM 10669]
MQSHNVPDPCTILCLEELEKKARRLANSTKTTIAAGNSVVIFTMLLLEEVLEQLALDPITNLASIIVVSNSIANLNTSVQIDP